MTTCTLTNETQQAVEFFERKLAFEIGPIGVKYAREAGEELQIIDLRTPELFAKSHVPGAVNILFDQLEEKLEQLDKEQVTVLYCYNITCHLAAKAALHLAKKGYRVKELVGGYEAWLEAELPVEGKEKAGSCSTSSCG